MDHLWSHYKVVLLFLLIWPAIYSLRLEESKKNRLPNIVFIIMDDVGMGDIGCFGNDTMKTPHIDHLATEGAKLTHHVSFPMCTPSRAALMTGRYPVRYGLASNHLIRVIIYVSSIASMPPAETTIAEMLKDGAGYATGLIGKWHLGSNCESENACSDPNGQGFDYFYGLPLTNLKDCGHGTVWQMWRQTIFRDIFISFFVVVVSAIVMRMRNIIQKQGFRVIVTTATIIAFFLYFIMQTMGLMNCILMENRKVIEQPLSYDNLNQRLTRRAISFIERNQNEPFFLVMSHIQAHTQIFSSEAFISRSQHGLYGAAVEEIDWSVGELMSSLKKLGLDNNTFVYLTSDNGAHIEERSEEGLREGGWNGIYRGGKTNTYEGGIRLPTVIRYPGVIQPGSVIDEPTHMVDLLPTVAGIAGVATPTYKILDGKDILPLLKGDEKITPHEVMFHYCGSYLHSARYRPRTGSAVYKVHYITPKLTEGPYGQVGCFQVYPCRCAGRYVNYHDPPLVYELTTDPSEKYPLDPSDPYIKAVITKVGKAVTEHKQSIEKASYQYSPRKLLFRPWKQPCCEGSVFPFCKCKENTDFVLPLPDEEPLKPEVEEIMPKVPSS